MSVYTEARDLIPAHQQELVIQCAKRALALAPDPQWGTIVQAMELQTYTRPDLSAWWRLLCDRPSPFLDADPARNLPWAVGRVVLDAVSFLRNAGDPAEQADDLRNTLDHYTEAVVWDARVNAQHTLHMLTRLLADSIRT
jgi:hypothetical protein